MFASNVSFESTSRSVSNGTLLEVLSNDTFDAEEKPEITDELVSFDEVIILELQQMVDSMAADDLLCRLVMGDLIFSE